MPDVHAHMQKILSDYRKKDPNMAYRFIDTAPDVLRIRTESDGWKPIKQEGSGVAGEVRVGDLILAGRPRADVDADRKSEQKRTDSQIDAVERAFNRDMSVYGGKYVKPLSRAEAEGFGKKE